MKINKLWIPMIIFGIIGGVAKICDTVFNVNSVGFILNSDICSAVFVASIVLVWLIGVIMLLADRKVEVSLTPPKSKATGFFGFIAAVSIMGSGIISLLSLGQSESVAGTLIYVFLGIIGGAVMLYESCISFTGHNGMTKFPLATLFLPAWACGRLITLFIQYSKVSIHATEMFDVISVTLLMLFLFYQAMLFAEIGPRTAVRRSTLYGICYVMCGLITTIDIMIKMFSPTPDTGGIDTLVVEPTFGRILVCVTDIAFAAYAVCFIASNARNADIDKFDEDDEYDDPEFLGAISEDRSEKAPEKPAKKRTSTPKSKVSSKPSKSLKISDDDEDYDDRSDKKLFKDETPDVFRGSLSFEEPEAETDNDVDEQKLSDVSETPEEDYDSDLDEPEYVALEPKEDVVFNTAENVQEEDYADDDSGEDYDELFRMLDELGSNDE